MSRMPAVCFLIALLHLGALPPLASAEADSIELREIRALKQSVEQQSKQIQALSEQVAKLGQQVEARKEAPPAAVPAPVAPSPTAEAAPAPEIRKATPPDAAARHVVEKGETLTSIAKRFNITITELKKLNKIEDERKLQIGQSLVIPSPKTSEPPNDKKENP